MPDLRYEKTGVKAQIECPHRIRNRDNTECSICGSRLIAGKWQYLNEDWFKYYTNGGIKPKDN